MKVLYNIKNVHIAKKKVEAGKVSYEKPFLVEGAVGLNFDPEGSEANFYADGKVYFRKKNNLGYTGEIELAMFPEQFITEILGRTKDSNGIVFENANDEVSDIALMFEADGDEKSRKFCFFDVSISRPSRENKTTEDEIEVGTEKAEITMSPRSTDGMIMCYADGEAEGYENFFNEVPSVVA